MSTLFLHTMLLICFVAAYANRDSQKRLYCRAPQHSSECELDCIGISFPEITNNKSQISNKLQ